MKKTKPENEYIDLNTCYFPEEEIPVEFMREDSLKEKSKTPVNMYLIAEDLTLLLMGDLAIKVNEHFNDSGKDIGSLLEDAIRYEKQKL